MLTQGAAMRFAEAAAGWLRTREPGAWLSRAFFVTTDGGKRTVLARTEAVSLLEKARAKAHAEARTELEREIAAGIDVIKAAAPIEVPVVVFLEKDGGLIEMGVLTVALPTKKKG
ncbi:MAG TPA: hypothetical protein VL400_18970 [Polyangiaceae bacterium]|jgi:hypothetical protein|nr:hypothetical protein [Polyangiaceae bacterium]